jgi:hypothetical protein
MSSGRSVREFFRDFTLLLELAFAYTAT